MGTTGIASWSTQPGTIADRDSILKHTHSVQSGIPAGAIMWFYLSAAPDGWVICDGTNGTPNLIGNYIVGATSDIGTALPAAIPNITGGAMHQQNGQQATGAFYNLTRGTGGGLGANDWKSDYNNGFGFDASRCSKVYTNNFNSVQPPSVKLLPCMKV